MASRVDDLYLTRWSRSAHTHSTTPTRTITDTVRQTYRGVKRWLFGNWCAIVDADWRRTLR